MTDAELRRAIRKWEQAPAITTESEHGEVMHVLGHHQDLIYALRMIGEGGGFGAALASLSLRVQALEQKKQQWDVGF